MGDYNETIEQLNDFMNFVFLSYDILNLYKVSSSYLSPFKRYSGGHFDSPPYRLVSDITKATLVF